MSDYICPGCDEPITEGYVIVGKSDSIPGSPWRVLHAGELKTGGIDEVTDQMATVPESCSAKYMLKDEKNDMYHSHVIPFSELENELKKD